MCVRVRACVRVCVWVCMCVCEGDVWVNYNCHMSQSCSKVVGLIEILGECKTLWGERERAVMNC